MSRVKHQKNENSIDVNDLMQSGYGNFLPSTFHRKSTMRNKNMLAEASALFVFVERYIARSQEPSPSESVSSAGNP